MKISFLMHEPIPELDELERVMRSAASLGYHGIELSAKHPWDYPLEAVERLSERYQLPVVSFLSGWSYAHEGLCLSRPDIKIRRRAVERLVEYLRCAARLRAILVMGLMQGLRSDEPDPELANERIAESLRMVAEAETGTQLVIEPVNHQQVGFNNSAEEVAAMVARVGRPEIGYMLDTIHMHIEERSLIKTIQNHGPHIRHFHLCESNGGPLGSGSIDFPAVLQTLGASGYSHYVSVKVYRKVSWEEAARGSAEFLRKLGMQFAPR